MYTISFKEGAKAGSPEEVLLSFKNKQGTYARIFETLCRYVYTLAEVLVLRFTVFLHGTPFKSLICFVCSKRWHL